MCVCVCVCPSVSVSVCVCVYMFVGMHAYEFSKITTNHHLLPLSPNTKLFNFTQFRTSVNSLVSATISPLKNIAQPQQLAFSLGASNSNSLQ